MFIEIFGLYVQGLLLSFVSVFLFCVFWLLYRVRQKKDKTLKERQAFLYDIMMIMIMTIPILAFAFMAILLVLRS
ncbi:hypothetical protein HMPREF9318_01314 [Streptococcus urinalis FB127-CNA-2]|uniref:DUF4059 family protein n=1 Tax=Streptococcus urinalis TaxID=149016 RepID=UPI000225C451|nr:DUF4059 family protein [Streptococcus urinalis]EKS19792.1 hypothetical protein HMPREF9318_01314 [Streptococcus urinalis FB127-CNA-2]VEF31368.1 membrane protein [Streptococcus urinalis]